MGKVTIASTFGAVDMEIERIKELFTMLNCSKLASKKEAVLFALRELLNNAVEHGNGSDTNKAIVYRIDCTGREIRLDVWDEGDGFILPEQPNNLAAQQLLEMDSYGLFIIREMNFQLDVLPGRVRARLRL